MIVDMILLVLQGILNILLAPLTVLNIGIDFIASIPVITEFIQIVAYVLPWNNLLLLFAVIFASFVFRVVLSLIKLVWHFIPLIGN